MRGMEYSMGLEDLTTVERDIYCAASELAASSEGAETVHMLEHVLVTNVSRPTFFRALKSLVNKGYLSNRDEACRGCYTVHKPYA